MRLQILRGLLVVIVALQCQLHAATPVDSVPLDSVTVEIPLGTVWHRVEDTSQRATYERITGGQRATLSISERSLSPLSEDKAFLQFAEEQQAAALSKLEMVSIHYNSTRKRGAPCLAYDGIYKDKGNQVLPFLTFRGQLCRHPDFAGRMIQVEVAQRSGTKEDAYKVDLLELSEKVFSEVVTGLPEHGQSYR